MIEIRRSALVNYSPAQMFGLVNDVEAYPKRFSWCAGAVIVERTDDVLVVRLDLKFAGFRQSFTTRNSVNPPSRLHMSLVDGPFRSLDGVWDFLALGDAGCKISFALDFDYVSRLGRALKLGFQGLANRMVDDFCREAERVMVDCMITVEVVYLDVKQQLLRRIDVVEGSTVLEAINVSGIAELMPAAALDPNRLGVFSKRVSADHVVQSDDRIEIYRPLIVDPMEARRRRAR